MMADVRGSTYDSENENPKTSGRLPGRLLHRNVPAVKAGPNELASTGRDWAAQAPPGMESKPLEWDEITKL